MQFCKENNHGLATRKVLTALTVGVSVWMEGARLEAAEPTLAWSTYLGGWLNEEVEDLGAEETGTLWVTGTSQSFEDFPAVDGFPPSSGQERVDPFLTRFSPEGSVGFSTLIPGPYNEIPRALVLTPYGVHLVGTRIEFTEFIRIYLARVDLDGSSFETATYTPEERSTAEHAVYAGGEVWLSGFWDQYDTGPDFGELYAWLPAGALAPVESRLISYRENPLTGPMAADAAGHVYVVGSDRAGDVRVDKLDRDLQVLRSLTWGGSGAESPGDIFADAAGNVWITGTTRSADFPLVDPVQSELRGPEDAFLVKLDPSGQVVLSTYLGGNGAEQGEGVAVDPLGAVYLSGTTGSADFPVTGGVPRSCAATAGSLCGPTDGFVARIERTGELGWALLLGGSDEETGLKVAAPRAGSVLVAGTTESSDLPVVNAFQSAPGGEADAFAARLETANLHPDCTAATASPAVIWPPNGRLVPVTVEGVTDPDGDPVEISVTAIHQDEPLSRPGQPDATGLGTSSPLFRADRAGGGDGRVYHLSFTATDPQGASCTGTATVCVPHDRGRRKSCGDGGPAAVSTVPAR